MRPSSIARLRSFGTIACVLGLGTTGAAWAQGAAPTIDWRAPPDCPSEAYVRSAVAQLLARGPASTAQVDVKATVTRAAGGRWTVRLASTRDGVAGERELQGSSCRSLADAAALIIALTGDPTRESSASGAALSASTPRAPSADGSAAAPPAPAASGSATAPRAAAESGTGASATSAPLRSVGSRSGEVRPGREGAHRQASRGPLHIGVFAALGGDVGSLPKADPGVDVALAAIVGWVRVEVYGVDWVATTGHTRDHPAAGGLVSLWSVGARACMSPWQGAWDVGPCAGIEAGDMRARGVGLVGAETTADVPWVAATLGARGTLRLIGPLRLGVHIEAVVPFVRSSFSVAAQPAEPSDLVHEPSWVEGRLYLGPELRF